MFFCCAIPAFAQKNYLDKVTDSTCKCLEASKDKIENAADFDKVGEACIIKSALPFLDSFAKDENMPVEDFDEEMGHKLGQKIGMKLITSCPFFIDLMALYSEEANDIVTGKASGLVTGVQISDHVYLDIKELSGKITKLAWVQYFPGAGAFKSSPSGLKGKRVEVEWIQQEIYVIAKKDFVTMKVITKLDMN